MSEIRTPPSLKWLIDKRARLLGEISKYEIDSSFRVAIAEKAIVDATNALVYAKQRLAYENAVRPKLLSVLREDLKTIDGAMALHEIQIDPDAIPQIRSQEAKKKLRYGVITRLIYECLKCAEKNSMTTSEIATFIAVRNNLDVVGDDFQDLRRSVQKRLKTMCAENKVERIHPAKTCLEGRWKLK
jgi:predicted ATP-dependent Lon-type protease